MVAKLSAPVDVQIELTQACNWRCRHCYNYWRPDGVAVRQSQHLSHDKLLRIVEELAANQVPSITITGGEPFSRRKDVFALLEMIQEVGMHASINTNLSLVREDDVGRLSDGYRHVPILFSLLSADAAEHERLAGAPAGNHSRVLENAALAIRRGLTVSLNMVLMRENLHAMEDTARLAKKLGVRTFCATKALPNIHTPDVAFLLTAEEARWSLAELMRIEQTLGIPVDILGCYPRCLFADTNAYRRFSHRTCVAGCTTATIGVDGSVRACSHMETSYGNIFDEPLASIWQKMDCWREGVYIPEACRGCQVMAACRGGCRVNTLASEFLGMDIYAHPRRMENIPRERLIPRIPEGPDAIPTRVSVCPWTRFRDEAFGALIYRTNPLAMVLVNSSAVAFLKEAMGSRDVFDFTTFLGRSGAKTDSECRGVERLYRKLVRKGFLVVPQRQSSDGKEVISMGEITVLRGFDFWSRGSDDRAYFSVRDVVETNGDVELAEAYYAPRIRPSDQGGDQGNDGGGGGSTVDQ